MIDGKIILEFLEKTCFIKANYQFVVLETLIKSKSASVELPLILKNLNKKNPGKKITFSNTPVFKVLTGKKFILLGQPMIAKSYKNRVIGISVIKRNFNLDSKQKRQALKEIKRILTTLTPDQKWTNQFTRK